jgi:DNA-binding NtrC family response regulator
MDIIAREKLELLIRIISDLALIDSQTELIRGLIKNAIEFTGADRGFLVLRDAKTGERFYDVSGEEISAPEISLSTISKALSDGMPLCLIEDATGGQIPQTASILALNLKTVMCAPLKLDNSKGLAAMLYVDSRILTRPFDRQDLDLFSILAAYAGVVWSNLELLHTLQTDFRLLHDVVRDKYDYHRIIGQCDAMRRVYEILEMLKETRLDVLIVGETGTGKELIAKAIHYSSNRSEGALKQINCAALPEGLVEAELFGVEKNVATEVSRRIGKLEQADGGTLFLDEIGDMSIRIQNHMLRFLEERKFRRLGGREEISSDVRILAATNKKLEEEIKAGRFRDALRYRLDIVTIQLPPLRERGDDLELLADFFLHEIVSAQDLSIKGFTAEASRMMKQYAWPGNVRELKHRVQGAVFLAKGQLIDVMDLGLQMNPGHRKILSMAERKAVVEKNLIQTALNRTKNDLEKAAPLLGISRKKLLESLKKHDLSLT